MARPISPTEILPLPGHAERRSSFMWRWMRSPRVKKMYHGHTTEEGARVWAEAKARSIVSVKTLEDEFLVFDDGQ
jgi:hypothetical protein